MTKFKLILCIRFIYISYTAYYIYFYGKNFKLLINVLGNK